MIYLDEICIILKYDEISSIHTLEFLDDISLMKSNSSWNITKVHISYNCFIHQPWMFSSSLISHSWKLMLLQFGNNSSNQWGYIHPWKLISSMYIDDLVSCFIRQQKFHFVHQFHPSSIGMMQMMKMDDDSSLHFHYQMGLNPMWSWLKNCERHSCWVYVVSNIPMHLKITSIISQLGSMI